MLRLSSRLTFIYRFIIPPGIVVAILILIFAAIFVLPEKYNDLYVVFIPLTTLLFLPIAFLFRKLRSFFIDGDMISIFDGKKLVARIPLKDVTSLERRFGMLYKICFVNNGIEESCLVLPKVAEAFMGEMIGENGSIKSFRKRVRSAKIVNSIIVFFVVITTACTPKCDWTGGEITDYGTYCDGELSIKVFEEKSLLKYEVRNISGDLLFDQHEYGIGVHQSWGLFLDKNKNLWVFSSDIGQTIWEPNSFGVYYNRPLDITTKRNAPPELLQSWVKRFLGQ